MKLESVRYVSFLLVCQLLFINNSFGIRLGGIFSEQAISGQLEAYPKTKNDNNGPEPIQSSTTVNQTKCLDRSARLAFEFSVMMLNKAVDEFLPNKSFTQNVVSFGDGPLQMFDLVSQTCEQLYIGVAAIIGLQYSAFTDSLCHAKAMPYIYVQGSSAKVPLNDDLRYTPYSFQMGPTYATVGRALSDLVMHYNWKTLTVLYCDDADLNQLEDLLQTLTLEQNAEISLLRARHSFSDKELGLLLQGVKRRKITKILLACSPHCMLLRILKKALEIDLMNRNFHYILSDLDSSILLRRNKYIFGHCNITCFAMVQENLKTDVIYSDWNSFLHSRLSNERLSSYAIQYSELPLTEFTTGAALMYDALQMYADALARVYHPNSFNHRSLLCTDDKKWDFGKHLTRSMLSTNITGLTGPVQFDETGARKNVQLDVLSITYQGPVKIGKFKDGLEAGKRLNMFSSRLTEKPRNESTLINRTFIVTTIVVVVLILSQESPYVFQQDSTSSESIYTGYCIDLLKLLANDVGFSYDIREVSDGEYGTMLSDGTWDGLIGELRSAKADIAVAPLTITYDREKVTCFTKPYMSLGVSILYRKPVPGNPNLFGFLNPLSLHIWILVLASYVAVSFLMYLIARLSPHERQQEERTGNHDSDEEDSNFSLKNSLWYGAGSLMQQGSDFSPKSISTRLLAAVWWFFSLIFISSYTANLAAFLTVTRMEVDISSADDLAAQTKIKYGTLKDGATATFFRNSKIKTYSQMWQYLNTTNDVFVKTNHEGVERVKQGGYAYLMESPTLQYIVNRDCNLTQVGGLLDARGYGIATMDPSLRDRLSVAILKFQEKGILDELRHKWWTHNTTECPLEVSSNTQSLDVSNLGGAFVFLAIGASVAIIAAILENFLHCRKNKGNTTQTKDIVKMGNGISVTCDHNQQPKPRPTVHQRFAVFDCCKEIKCKGQSNVSQKSLRVSKKFQPTAKSRCTDNEKSKLRPAEITETVLSDTKDELASSRDLFGENSCIHPRTHLGNSSMKNSYGHNASVTYVWNKPPTVSYCDSELSKSLGNDAEAGNLSHIQRSEYHKHLASCEMLNENRFMSKVSEYKQTSM